MECTGAGERDLLRPCGACGRGQSDGVGGARDMQVRSVSDQSGMPPVCIAPASEEGGCINIITSNPITITITITFLPSLTHKGSDW